MSLIDYVVLFGCLVGMLAVGWYYGRRTATRRDYLLGGGNMRPWAVGLSLFATLISTISYLAWPGEVILHGPMMLASVLAYPFVAVVVGWFLIPHFMGLSITSAYELLETRLGPSIRYTGSGIFLTLRLLWMAVIIHATTVKVLIPILEPLGVTGAHTPWISIALGLITVIYTSQGGMRAVVWTNVIQTFVLFGGAILAIAIICYRLGSVTAIWPTEWSPHWDPLVVVYAPEARVTLFGAMFATFMWYVCTAGSDQMAIQRYLATRDAAAARRMFNVNLTAEFLVHLLLAALGLALLAYSRVDTSLLADGQLSENADKILVRFIASNLPIGLGGLIASAILATAMSSLSSGLNSACAVITTDFLDRLPATAIEGHDPELLETKRLRRTRRMSWLVGVVVILLSTQVGIVQGNLLEIAYKVVNLLVAPLFGLFFLALFVPFANSFGTLVGTAFGIGTVVAINYWKEITGAPGISFLWGMPLGLAAQVVTGSIASLLYRGAKPGRQLP